MPYRFSLLLALLLLPAMARAGDDSRGVFSLMIENDAVGDTDQGYTNGLRAAWTSPAGKRPFWAGIGLEKLPLLARDATLRYEASLGQSIFTPQNIDRVRADPRDRPYAGFTHVGLGVTAVAPARTSGVQRIDQLQLTLGIIGPASLAGDTQITWHRWFGFAPPNGWAGQLRNEPALNLSYRQSLRLPPAHIAGLDADLTPHWGFAIGNVYDYANAGATLRIGSDLPTHAVGRIEPSIAGGGAFNRSRRVHLQAFAGVDARAIARNIFLDGNSFRSGPSVDKNAIVVDVEGGAVLTWRGVRLSYTHVFRSREFKRQPRPANFGSLGLAFAF